MADLKQELAAKAEVTSGDIKLTSSMSIQDMIRAMTPEIKKALPSVLTVERFTRMAVSAMNNTPELAQCTPISVLTALMNAAQLGLEPNTPLGQAYLIPYKNKGVYECQFQIGYKGFIDLAYRNEQMQTIQAQTVYENDQFDYELGLEPKLVHRPAYTDKGEPVFFYGLFRTKNGGYGFSVMSKPEMDDFANKYSKSFSTSFSPWKSSYEDMAKKTVIKQALKYAPIKTELQKIVSVDESIKNSLAVDMTEVPNEIIAA